MDEKTLFPIDMSSYKPLVLDLSMQKLTPEQKEQLEHNIKLVRDAIVFFTAYAGVRGFGGHTGGAYDIVPEVLIADGFMRNENNNVYPVFWDEAGHRVALQYIMTALDERESGMNLQSLFHYREHGYGLYGHPERDEKHGIKFSSGRLGHMWSYINGVALAHPNKKIILFGSDGSQQEGNDAEAARFAVAHKLNVKLCLDDNNITISGHPKEYMRGFDLEKTLLGHGLRVYGDDGEDFDFLYRRMRDAFTFNGPVALINRRHMAPGIVGVENTSHGHDVIGKDAAISYLSERGYDGAVELLKTAEKIKGHTQHKGSSEEVGKNRSEFGKIIVEILSRMSEDERRDSVRVIDSDLEGSTGIKVIREKYPEVYLQGGIMERHNFSAAAGFGNDNGKQGIFATFSAFSEMIISELTMARLNHANVLAHFSHAGVDWMADNTCHYGINNFFLDNALEEGDSTRLYFPADVAQLRKVLPKVFADPGVRFIFSTRSPVPYILKEDGSRFFEEGYEFVAGKDEIIREGSAGYVVAYGEMLYRALDAVERLREEGLDVGLINKPTLNIVDEEMMQRLGKSAFVLVVETQNAKTGLGSRFGTWLLERGFSPKYAHMGVHKLGQGGIYEQVPYQGLDSKGIMQNVKKLIN